MANQAPAAVFTADEAVKAVKGTVRVIKTKDGENVLDEKGRPVIVERPLRAEDVISCTKDAKGGVTVVTVDGQKLTSQAV